jgi:hypothetical protein
MVEQILSLSLQRNIPVANYTVAVGFETTPQRMDQMRVSVATGLVCINCVCFQLSLLCYVMVGLAL